MTELNQDTEILNAIVSSMRMLVGEYANLILRGVNGLIIDKNGKITKVDNLKSVMNALVNKYENVMGNSATVKIADSLIPYVKKNEKLRNALPKAIQDAMNQTIDVSESLSRWNKKR